MHGEGGTHALWLVSLLGKLQILTKHRAIIRMRTVFDNLLGTAQRTLATKIGLKDHLSPTRSNGLLAMIKQIRMYALAYKTKEAEA